MINIPRWQVWLVVALCLLGVIAATPNLLSRQQIEGLPGYAPSAQFNLGLDLKGGAHLLLEVDSDDYLASYLESAKKSLRKDLRAARIMFRDLKVSGKAITFSVVVPDQSNGVRDILSQFVRDNTEGTGESPATRRVFEARLNGSEASVRLTAAGKKSLIDKLVRQSIEVIRVRIDESGTKDPTVQRQGSDRILVQVPGIEDTEALKRKLPVTAKLTFHLVNQSIIVRNGMRVPRDSMLLPSKSDPNSSYLVYRNTIIDGQNLKDARQTFDQGRPVVAFRFDRTGARIFGGVTSQNVGKPFAIVLDGKVISAPVIQTPITDGRGIITGGFTVSSANELALLLRAGALPAPMEVIEERSVGPGLGADAIAAGKLACVLGLALVMIFMVATYGRFGVMANVALVLNLVLLAALLSLIQATLTLPGIAGIVLTIGMAVDANVLIFERIREEARAGRSTMAAIDAGYRRALTTIVDSNVTTLIAALLLFIVGSGPIKGFGVTLALGLVTSMFTAFMVTRLMVVAWWRRARSANLPI